MHHRGVRDLENVVEDIFEEFIFDGFFDDGSELSDSSSSSEDENEVEQHQRVSIANYVENTVHLYSETEFQSHFRLKRTLAFELIERFSQTNYFTNNEPHEDSIPYERDLLITLWYLANTETFRQIADRFDLSQSSAHRVLKCTIKFVNSLVEEFIKWPTEQERRELSRRFSRVQNIHGVIGAIDGCHVRIRKPTEYQRDYYNRKKFHSVVIQAVVIPEKLFTDVFIGEPGSMHDARILRKSPLYGRVLEDPGFLGRYFILGDSAYPNMAWLVAPFRDNGHLSPQQREFNYKHASTRVKVEQAFGLLRARFRRLTRFDNLRLPIIISCIMAACILRNICILHENENDFGGSSDDGNDDDEQFDDDVDEEDGATDRRQQLFNRMFALNNN